MSILEFIAAMTKYLAYPAVIVIVVLVFRRPIGDLIERLKELSISRDGTGAKFDVKTKDVEKVIEKMLPPQSNNVEKIEAEWGVLEGMVQNRLAIANVSVDNLDGEHLLMAAKHRNLLTDDQFNSLRGLLALRNLAVLGRSDDITEKRVKDFVLLAKTIGTVLDMTKPKKN
jgi:hypothetical protein